MKFAGWMTTLVLAVLPAAVQAQAPYSVKTMGDVVQLRDARADTTVSVLVPVNNAYEMVVKSKNIIRMTISSVDDMRARPGLNGVPLLAPFANRNDGTAFYANGKKYNFDMERGNVRGPIPIHGYLSGTNAWKLVEAKADEKSAWVTSRLEFYKYPDYMQQFPFAHTLTVTYRLAGGALEVHTRVDNLSTEPMPVVLGWHPYFAVSDSSRSDWVLRFPPARRWVLTFSASTLTRWADSFKDSSMRLYSAVPNRACRISSRFCELALRNSKNLPCGSMITWRNCSLLKPSKVSTFSPTFLQPDSTGTSTSRPPSVVRRDSSATCAWVISRPLRLAGRSCSGTRLTR